MVWPEECRRGWSGYARLVRRRLTELTERIVFVCLCFIVKMTSAHSLVSAVDELISITTVLTTGYEHDESEFLKFVAIQEKWRKKWQAAQQSCSQLQWRVFELSEANNSLEVQLKHARSMAETEMRKRQRAESQVEYLVRGINIYSSNVTDYRLEYAILHAT